MHRIRDKHKGKMCFVLGSGPSLRHIKPDLLKPYITIAVNSSIAKIPFADYYFTCDVNAPNKLSFRKYLQSDKCTFIALKENYHKEENLVLNGGRKIPKERLILLDRNKSSTMKNTDTHLIRGASSVHCAVHIAHIMGCTPIILLGCDCCIEKNKEYFYEFPGETYDKTEYCPYKRTSYLRAIKYTWDRLALLNKHIKIINASGGILSAFPRMTLNDVLKKYGANRAR